MRLDWFTDPAPTPTRYPRLFVWRVTATHWRILATDDCRDTGVTGPAYRTKGEALAALAGLDPCWHTAFPA